MSITAEQKQTLAGLYDQFNSPVGTSIVARNTHYFLVAVKKAGVDSPDKDILAAASKARSGVQFASIVSDKQYTAAVSALKASTDNLHARIVAASSTPEELAKAKSEIDNYPVL